MQHCSACGQACADDARFCGQCGAVLAASCAKCGVPLAAGQRFCSACGAPAAAPPSAEEPGERRHATIVFSDLSGYTALNERIDPEDVGLVMTDLRDTATRVVEAHGGIVNQIVGDEIMALFGVPQAGRDDAVRALRATLELHRAVRDLAERHAARTGVRLDLHSGVNSGLVVVRPCAPHQGRFGLTGDAVNTAARLLKLADAGQIVIGADTWAAASSHFEAERLPEAMVRGKALPVQPWRLVREVELRPAAPLLGRDDELAHARAALQSSLGPGGARWVIVRGEPGIGKSRLLVELCDAARAAGAAIAAAAVPDFGPARGSAAWRGLIAALLELAPRSDTAAIDAALAAAGLPAPLKPHALALLDCAMPESEQVAYAALDTAARERGARDAAAALLRARAERGGLLLALEDTHWAEAPALALLARVAAACRDCRLLLAVTTRPHSEAFDAARQVHAPDVRAVTLDLGPLDVDAAHALALHLAGSAPEVAARCVERAGGNPLFLEQLLRATGEALRDALPGSIQALVLARIDRLAPADKTALQAASVLGQRVDLGAWGALVEAPRVEPLIEAGLLRPDDEAAHFVHALVRDGTYASLLKARRRELHQRAADWFADRDLGLRAEHLALAESPAAAAAFGAAARAEVDRFRYAAALALVERGQACALSAVDRHALAMLRGETLRELGRNAEARAAFEAARDDAGSDTETALAWYQIATVQRLLSQVDAAWRSLDAAEPVAQRLGDALWQSRIHYLRGNLCFARGDGTGCAQQHAQALALARACGDALAEAQALSGLGDAHYASARIRSALEAFERCVEACRRAGALRFAVMNQAMVGWCQFWNGDPASSLRELRAAAAAAVALSHRNAEAMATESLGMCLVWMGDAEAPQMLERAIALSREAGMQRFELISRVALARARRMAGASDEARALALESWRQCEAIGAQAFAGPLLLAEMARCSTDPAEADAWLAQAEVLLGGGAVAHNHFWVHPEAIWLRLHQGRHDEVLRHADALEAYARDEPVFWVTHHVTVARALVRAARGNTDPALRDELERLLAQARAAALADSTARLVQALQAINPA